MVWITFPAATGVVRCKDVHEDMREDAIYCVSTNRRPCPVLGKCRFCRTLNNRITFIHLLLYISNLIFHFKFFSILRFLTMSYEL
jgi:hypothetical protein